MRTTWTFAIAAALSLSCASAPLDGGPLSPVRLDTQDAVGWEPGGPFPLELMVYNASGHRLVLARPKADALQVKVFRASGEPACRTPSPTRAQVEGWDARAVQASQGLRFTVDLWPYCRDLPEGLYRYEATYVANPASASEVVFTGTLGPRSGRIAVGRGLSSDEAALAAVLATPSPSPAELGRGPGGGAASGAPSAPTSREQSPEAIRACMDRELAARGLNAYGDPQGTTYPGGPPADEGGRVLFVLGRNPEIRAACRIQGF